MKNFDEIYILDLHGNALKREKCPDGSKDENVFAIRQGVAIAFFVKNKSNSSDECKVFHSEIWGLREKKYGWLNSHDIKTTEWKEIHPHSPFYFFVPREEKYEKLYNKFWKVTDIFPINSVGIVTSRDNFVIDFDKDILRNRIDMFRNPAFSDENIKETFKLRDKQKWKVNNIRKKLMCDNHWEKYFYKILYRPFDERHIYYHPMLIERPRLEVMRHMMNKNLAFLTMRQVSLDEDYTHFLISEFIVDNRTFLSSKGILQLFPLYLYKNSEKTPNILPTLLKELKAKYDNEVGAEEILYYIYAVSYSNIYRTKYAEFLKIDFPKVPFTTDYDLFIKMARLGKKLVDLHLMKSDELNIPVAKFQGDGDNIVRKPVYDEKRGRVYINKTQYFEGIKENVWKYQIGGYQVLDKWLKDRKGRKLSLEEIKHYCKVVTALKKTMEIQEEIDKLYPGVEKEIIPFKENKNRLEDFEAFKSRPLKN